MSRVVLIGDLTNQLIWTAGAYMKYNNDNMKCGSLRLRQTVIIDDGQSLPGVSNTLVRDCLRNVA